MKFSFLLIPFTVAALCAPAVWASQLDITINGDIRLGRRLPPPPPRVEIMVGEHHPTGPSSWERRRWNRRSQGYYYYPGSDVYYRQADRVWFYQQRGRWRNGRNLPDFVNIDFDRSITLTMTTNRPYTYHPQVSARYPANYFDRRRHHRNDDRNNHHDNYRDHDRDRDHNRDRDRERQR